MATVGFLVGLSCLIPVMTGESHALVMSLGDGIRFLDGFLIWQFHAELDFEIFLLKNGCFKVSTSVTEMLE